MSFDAKFISTTISMINLRKLLTRKVLCYSEIWSSRFHLWTVSRKRGSSETHKAWTCMNVRSRPVTRLAEFLRYPRELEARYEEPRSLILFVRATWREHVIAVELEPHRQLEAIFGLIHIVPGRHTCVSLVLCSMAHLHADCTSHVKERYKASYLGGILVISSYCPHSIYFRSHWHHLCYMCLLIDLSKSTVYYWYFLFVLASCVQCTGALYCHWQLFLLDVQVQVLNICE